MTGSPLPRVIAPQHRLAPRPERDEFNLLGAKTDERAVELWLYEVENPKTKSIYRRESDRVLLWCEVTGTPLRAMDKECWVKFFEALGASADTHERFAARLRKYNTTLHAMYERLFGGKRDFERIGALQDMYEKLFGGRRGFVGIGAHRVSYAKLILSGMCTWLAKNGYLAANVVPPPPKYKVKAQFNARVGARTLSDEQDEIMKDVLYRLSWEDEAEARMRFVVTWLALTGARRNELGTATTTQLHETRSGDDAYVLWARIGKQSTEQENVVEDLAVQALIRYRLSLGKPSATLWHKTDEPLVFALGGRDRVINENTKQRGDAIIYDIVCAFAARCAASAATPTDAERLSKQTPHWLRHRCARMLLSDPTVNVRDVQSRMNHASLTTTGMYGESDAADVGKRLAKARRSL